LKLLETLEIRVLKRLASAVQLRPWPPYFQSLNSTLNRHRRGCAEPRPEFSGVEQFFPFSAEDIPFPLGFLITGVTSKVTVKVILWQSDICRILLFCGG
jgi:hypothetical protein